MGLIYYFHYHPDHRLNLEEHYSMKPHPYDYAGTGYFSDVLYHSRNTKARFYIVTFGYERGWPKKETPPRVIDRYHLHFVFEGEGEFNGMPVHGGQILIVPNNTKYYIKSSAAHPLTLGWIGLSGRMSESIIEALHLPKDPILAMPFEHIEEIRRIFLETVYETPSDFEIPWYLFGQFFRVMALSGASSTAESSTTSEYTHRAIAYINSHFMENITVSDVAKAARASEPYLRVLFAQELGMSPHDFICEKRITAAKALLREDKVSIADIAESCGYADRSAFAKRFKQETGMTPNEYRRENK